MVRRASGCIGETIARWSCGCQSFGRIHENMRAAYDIGRDLSVLCKVNGAYRIVQSGGASANPSIPILMESPYPDARSLQIFDLPCPASAMRLPSQLPTQPTSMSRIRKPQHVTRPIVTREPLECSQDVIVGQVQLCALVLWFVRHDGRLPLAQWRESSR